jgi:putative phosphoribosyl transferase
MRFHDRTEAGRLLADKVQQLDLRDPVVLALPRGGVPVAFEVAAGLDAPLDVFVARKVGAPGHPELGIGAIAEGGGHVVSERSLRMLRVTPAQFDDLARRERDELDRRVHHYRGGRPLPGVDGRDVVLVDDGLATGVTAEAALRALRAHRPRRLVLAVPVCALDTAHRLAATAELVCVQTPLDFMAVGAWYDDFGQTTDDEVIDLLDRATTRARPGR